MLLMLGNLDFSVPARCSLSRCCLSTGAKAFAPSEPREAGATSGYQPPDSVTSDPTRGPRKAHPTQILRLGFEAWVPRDPIAGIRPLLPLPRGDGPGRKKGIPWGLIVQGPQGNTHPTMLALNGITILAAELSEAFSGKRFRAF